MGLKDLKIIMKIKGISPEELSKKSGVPKSTIDKILSGNTPDPRYNTVKELVNALNLNVDELIYYLDLSADDISSSLTPQDLSVAHKYHALDIHGKELVSLLLQKEYERCSASQPYTKIVNSKAREDYSMVAENTISYMSDNISSYESELNAAHERTDVEITGEMKKCDDDIMDGDDF